MEAYQWHCCYTLFNCWALAPSLVRFLQLQTIPPDTWNNVPIRILLIHLPSLKSRVTCVEHVVQGQAALHYFSKLKAGSWAGISSDVLECWSHWPQLWRFREVCCSSPSRVMATVWLQHPCAEGESVIPPRKYRRSWSLPWSGSGGGNPADHPLNLDAEWKPPASQAEPFTPTLANRN